MTRMNLFLILKGQSTTIIYFLDFRKEGQRTKGLKGTF